MRARTRYPRVASLACSVYRLSLWTYPTEFRHAYGEELVITFRNRIEDVLNEGGIFDWLAFATHIAADTLRTSAAQVAEVRLRGLDMSALFVAGGFVLCCASWYVYISLLLSYVQD